MNSLPADQLAWLPIAARIMAGDYREADDSTRDSLTIGLRSIEHPEAQAAIVKLWPEGLPKHLKKI